MQQQTWGFSVEEAITRPIVSKSNSDKCKMNDKVNKNHLLQNVHVLQLKVNNLNITRFKVKQRNLFGLALIDTGSLVHSSIISGEFWEAIGWEISNFMDCKAGTTDGQSKGLQVLGIGEP